VGLELQKQGQTHRETSVIHKAEGIEKGAAGTLTHR
jgi:hypothetical protein